MERVLSVTMTLLDMLLRVSYCLYGLDTKTPSSYIKWNNFSTGETFHGRAWNRNRDLLIRGQRRYHWIKRSDILIVIPKYLNSSHPLMSSYLSVPRVLLISFFPFDPFLVVNSLIYTVQKISGTCFVTSGMWKLMW